MSLRDLVAGLGQGLQSVAPWAQQVQQRDVQQQELELRRQQMESEQKARDMQLMISLANVKREQAAQAQTQAKDILTAAPVSYQGGPDNRLAPGALDFLTQQNMTSGLNVRPAVSGDLNANVAGAAPQAFNLPAYATKPAGEVDQLRFNADQAKQSARDRIAQIMQKARGASGPDAAALYNSIDPTDARTGYDQDVMALVPPGLQSLVKPAVLPPQQPSEIERFQKMPPEQQAVFLQDKRRLADSTYHPPTGGAGGGSELERMISGGMIDPEENAKEMIAGRASPLPLRDSKLDMATSHYVAQNGGNRAMLQQQWLAAQQGVKGLTGRQADQNRVLIGTALQELDKLDALAQQLDQKGIPIANKAHLMGTMQVGRDPDARALAAQYLQQLEFAHNAAASVLKSGNATPTDPGIARFANVLSGDWDRKTLQSAIQNVRTNFGYRQAQLSNMGNYMGGLDQGNPYTLTPQATPSGRTGGAGPSNPVADVMNLFKNTQDKWIQDPAHPGAKILNPDYRGG